MSRLALLSPLALASACGFGAAAQEPEFRPPTATPNDRGELVLAAESLDFVEVTTVGDDEVGAIVRAPGRVAFRDDAVSEVGAPVDGRVTEVHVRVGQRVAAGDPLVTIASPSAASVRSELARARVLERAAELEVARQEQLAARGVGIESDRVRAEADLAQARAMRAGLSSTAASLGRGPAASVVLRAPIDGSVLSRRATVGAAVEVGGEPLLVLGEPGAVWVIASVFERELSLVTAGSTARVELAGRGEPAPARVEAVGAAVDPSTHRAPVYLSLDPEVAPELRDGMYARVEIDAGESVLGIPARAVLLKEGGRTIVFVQRDETTFVSREVQLGAPVAGRVPVLAGLTPGERLVTRGALLLDGQAELLR